jgi:hypothetical protein
MDQPPTALLEADSISEDQSNADDKVAIFSGFLALPNVTGHRRLESLQSHLAKRRTSETPAGHFKRGVSRPV